MAFFLYLELIRPSIFESEQNKKQIGKSRTKMNVIACLLLLLVCVTNGFYLPGMSNICILIFLNISVSLRVQIWSFYDVFCFLVSVFDALSLIFLI